MEIGTHACTSFSPLVTLAWQMILALLAYNIFLMRANDMKAAPQFLRDDVTFNGVCIREVVVLHHIRATTVFSIGRSEYTVRISTP